MANKSNKKFKNPFLIGKKVYLRPVELSDAPIIQKWHNDPELRRLARHGELPVTKESEEENIKSAYSKQEGYLMIIKKSDNKPIGFVRFNIIDSIGRNVWLRLALGDKNTWGRHYASEALHCVLEWLFDELNIHRITLETYSTNKRAIRFFEKMGFKREGVIREALYMDGQYYDIISFGLLKSEFVQKQ